MPSSTDPDVSLEALYADLRLPLLRLAVLLVGDREHAEDVVQAAFVSAWQHRREVEQPRGYLRRAVVNGCADVHRRAFRRVLPDAAEPVTHIPEVDETWQVLARLPTRQRQVVVLRFYEDLPLVEIARILRRPAVTVRSDLHRALRTLRKELS